MNRRRCGCRSRRRTLRSTWTHRVEIQKPGYRRFSTEIQVRRGETTPLNVSLSPEGSTRAARAVAVGLASCDSSDR
ncbi:MAG: PEGA domain-containing protein [Acidobacteria bacterium]|nr:PEGA domain-containing protein [Acidobacteriota bacterium]